MLKCVKMEVLGGLAALGRLHAREAIWVPFKFVFGASRGGSWSGLGRLLGAQERAYGRHVGPKRLPEALKK